MATAVFTGMTNFGSSADGADAGWTDFGGGPGGGANTDDFIEGTNCWGGRKTVDGRGVWYDEGTGVDMSTTETHIYIWIQVKSAGNLETIANGGIQMRIGSDASNYRTFYVGGVETVKPGWNMIVIDPTKTGSEADVGSPDMTSVQFIGPEFQWLTTPGGTSDNVLLDVIRYSTGPYVTGGTTGDRLTWDDIAVADEASAYGIFNRQRGGFFVNGQLALGAPSGTGDFYLDDEAVDIVWASQEYEDGTAIVTNLATDFNALVVQEGTGTTDIEDGTLIGSGDDRSGVAGSKLKKDPVAVDGGVTTNVLRLDLSGTITALDWHGTTFEGFDNAVTLSDDATDGPNHVYAGVTFTGCEMVASGRVVIRNAVLAGYTGTQGALDWEANADIRNSSFLGNTDGTNDPAGIYHQTEGDFSYIGLVFSGNDVDIRNSNNATSVQTYANSNQDSEVTIGDGTTDAVSHSFAGVAGQLVKGGMYLRKVGTPTGNAYLQLYAHSGTFGTSSVPTGAVLIQSTAFDVSTLTGSLADVEIFFEAAAFALLAGATNYCLVLDCSGITGDGSNHVAVGYDGSAPSAAGNAATQATAGGGWTSQSYDLIHDVWRDGEVEVSASSGSDPTSKSRTGSPTSAIAIINTVTLKVTALDEAGDPVENAQTGIFVTATGGGVSKGDELISGSGGSDTNASGEVENAGYNYAGAVNVEVRSRKSSSGDNPRYKHLRSPQVIGASGLNVTVTLIEDPQNN